MLRQEDVLSVATALYGEIMLLRKEAAQLSRAVAAVHINVGTQRNPIRRFDSHFLEENQLSEPMLYKALAARVGILPPRLVLGIAEFHQNFQEARTWLPLLLEKEDRKYTFGATSVLIPARDAIRNVVPTLRAIEAMANISELAPEQLDTGHADTIIELETEDDNIPVPEE
jgi:hypothetical protein